MTDPLFTDLAHLITAPPDPAEAEIGFHQGKVIAFDLNTGANTIRIKDSDFTDLPVMNVTDSAGLLPGMIVGVLRIRSTYFVIGRIANPNSTQFGDITVRNNAGDQVRLSGGDVMFKRGSVPGQSYGRMYAAGDGGRVWTTIRPPYTRGDGSENRLIIEGRSEESPQGHMFLTTGGQGSVTAGGQMFLHGETFGQLYSNGDVNVQSKTALFLASDGTIFLNSITNDVRITHDTATSQPAALISAGNNRIYRSTSVRASKLEIQDLELDPEAVLKLKPRTWFDRGEVERNDGSTEGAHRGVGFVAEEVEEIEGMEPFLYRGEDGELVALAYDRFAAALVLLAQRQQKRLDDMEARLAKLEEKLG